MLFGLAIEGSGQPEHVAEITVGAFIEIPREPDPRLHADDLALPLMFAIRRMALLISRHLFYTG